MQKVGLCYGLWSNTNTLSLLHHSLTEAGYEVVLLRQDEDRSITHNVNDCVRLALQRARENQVEFLVGHSTGGLICLKLAEELQITNPGQIKKMLLFAPAAPKEVFPLSNCTQVWVILKSIYYLITQQHFRPSLKTVETVLVNQHEHLKISWEYSEFLLDYSSLFSSVLIPGLSVKNVSCPAMIVVGEKDGTTPCKVVAKVFKKYFSARFGSELIIQPNHDHMSILKHKLIIQQGINFLKGVSM